MPLLATNRTIKLWSLETGTLVGNLTGHTDNVLSASFSPDGNVLATSGDINDKTVRLWFLSENRNIVLKGHSDWFGGIYATAFTSDSKYVASGSKDKTIKLWQVNTGKEVMTFAGHKDDVTSVAISKKSKIITSASKDKTLRLWELNTGKLISTIDCPEKIGAVAFSPDSRILASGCKQGEIKLFKPQPKLSNSLQEIY